MTGTLNFLFVGSSFHGSFSPFLFYFLSYFSVVFSLVSAKRSFTCVKLDAINLINIENML